MEQNTPTQIQELLKPRYLVIADYPGSYYDKGEIVEEDYFYAHEGGYHHSDYPHLFRKLEWWEHRSKNDMPKYIKWTNPATKEVSFFEVFQWLSNSAGVYVADIREYHLLIRDIEPATETEYLTYQSSK